LKTTRQKPRVRLSSPVPRPRFSTT
jgi:hypothetical protein